MLPLHFSRAAGAWPHKLLCVRAERLGDVGKRCFLGVTDLDPAETEETVLLGGLGHALADSPDPVLERPGVTRRFGRHDGCGVAQTGNCPLENFGRGLGTGEAGANYLLDLGAFVRRPNIGDNRLDEVVCAGISLGRGESRAARKGLFRGAQQAGRFPPPRRPCRRASGS